LSLNAERNCVQKSGAKRREVIRWDFIAISSMKGAANQIAS